MTTDVRLTRSVPTLASLGFDETIDFYTTIGFVLEFRDLELMGMSRDGVAVHFWITGNRRIPQSTSCWIDVENIEGLYQEMLDRDVVHRRGHLEAKPWGVREFDIVDCHGNLIRFCERLAAPVVA